MTLAPQVLLRCSFCNRDQKSVHRLVASPGENPIAYICDECVDACQNMLREDQESDRVIKNDDHRPRYTLNVVRGWFAGKKK